MEKDELKVIFSHSKLDLTQSMKTPNTINETNMQDINSKVQDEQKRKVMQSEVTRLFMFSSCYPSEGESLLYMVCILRNLSKVQSVGCPQ